MVEPNKSDRITKSSDNSRRFAPRRPGRQEASSRRAAMPHFTFEAIAALPAMGILHREGVVLCRLQRIPNRPCALNTLAKVSPAAISFTAADFMWAWAPSCMTSSIRSKVAIG